MVYTVHCTVNKYLRRYESTFVPRYLGTLYSMIPSYLRRYSIYFRTKVPRYDTLVQYDKYLRKMTTTKVPSYERVRRYVRRYE